MATYNLKARRVDEKTVVWDSAALYFFNNVINRVTEYSFSEGYIYWDCSMAYAGSLNYEYIKYRNSDGIIITVGQGERVTTYIHSYDGRVGLAALPSGYNPLGLLMQNTSNPYLEVKFASSQTIRENETTYNEHIDSAGTFIPINVTYKDVVINSSIVTREYNNERYVLDLKSNYFNKYVVEVIKVNPYEGDSVSISITSTQEVTYIPEKYFQEGSNILNITVYNGTKTATRSIVINRLTPSISGLKIENENNLIDDVTTISWISKNQGRAEIYNNNNLIKTINGTITLAVLPMGTLQVGKNKITVRIYSPIMDEVVNGQNFVLAETTVTLQRIVPMITGNSFTINDTNVDNKITFTWEASNQSRFMVYQENKLVAKGEKEQTKEIDEGILNIGYKSLKLVIYYDSGFDSIQTQEIIEVVLTRNTPIIYNLEPSDLNINVDEIVNVTFATNEFCDRWELTAAGLITKGTDARSISFGKSIFKQGNNEMTIKTYYSPTHNTNEVRTAIKKVTFNGYGTPEEPTFDGNTLYSSATPTLTWKAIEQVEIHLLIIEADTEEVLQERLMATQESSIVTDALEDNKTYIAKLSIKNKYGLWSEYAEKEFETKFNDIILPTFDVFEAETSVILTIDGIQDSNFKSISIYRKSERESAWVEIADNCNVEDSITDYTCPANVTLSYKLRVYDKNNAYKDTEIKNISIGLNGYVLTNLENKEESYTLFGTPSYVFNSNFVNKLYAGQRAPRTFKDKVRYKTGTFGLKAKNRIAFDLIEFIENSNPYNLFCLRDQRGDKLYVVVKLESQDPVGSSNMALSFSFTEVNFIEVKMYTGSGFKKIAYQNGEYYLDGSLDLSGYDLSVVLG